MLLNLKIGLEEKEKYINLLKEDRTDSLIDIERLGEEVELKK